MPGSPIGPSPSTTWRPWPLRAAPAGRSRTRTTTPSRPRATIWNITSATADHSWRPLPGAARPRWKIENENNNPLKTKGYHLEHNFAHGQQHLSSLLAAMNILAFLCHTVLSFTDQHYRLIRATLPTRKTFFEDLRALTRYLHFPSWEGLLRFMMRGLEIGPYAKPT